MIPRPKETYFVATFDISMNQYVFSSLKFFRKKSISDVIFGSQIASAWNLLDIHKYKSDK